MPQLLDCYLFEVNHRYKYKDPITPITKYFKSEPTQYTHVDCRIPTYYIKG